MGDVVGEYGPPVGRISGADGDAPRRPRQGARYTASGNREIFRRLWAKIIIAVWGERATAACGDLNLCAGLPAGIEGAIHAVQAV